MPTYSDETVRCECCGRLPLRCDCEFVEVFCVDRMEGGEAIGPGHYEEHCRTHEEPLR